MKIVENERVVFCDVDDTLIMHNVSSLANLISVEVKKREVNIVNPATGENVRVWRNTPMIKCLIEEHHRGAFIVVWSMGGYKWAKNVLTALGIDDKINLVMSKPFAYFDDKPIESWLKYRLYIEADKPYKEG